MRSDDDRGCVRTVGTLDGTWRKPSYSGTSGGNCVEVASWRKATYSGSGGGNCVEVTNSAPTVLVRDTTDRDGGTLAFTGGVWAAFTASLR